MDIRNPVLRAVRTFTGPVWEYATLAKEVVEAKTLIAKVKTGKTDLVSVLAYGVTAAVISGILQYVFKVPPLVPDGIPLISDAAACFAVFLVAAIYITPQHFVLRRRNREIRYIWALTAMSCAIAVLYPLFILAGIGSEAQRNTDDPSVLQTIVSFIFLLVFFRIGSLLYDVKVRTVLWANFVTNSIVVLAVCGVMAVVYGVRYLTAH